MAYPLEITDAYDALFTTTLRHYIKQMRDNVFGDIPAFAWLDAKKRKKLVDGGLEIIQPLMYGKSTASGWYSKYGLLDTTPQEGISAARYLWKQLYASIAISRKEERQNSGEHRLLGLLDSKIMQAEKTLREKVSLALFAGFAGAPEGYEDKFEDADDPLTSLATFVPHNIGDGSSAPTVGTVGHIAGATYDFWAAQTHKITTTNAADPDLLGGAMAHLYHLCNDGGSQIDLILSDLASYEYYEKSLMSLERFTNTMAGDLGFTNITFKNATMIFDQHHKGVVTAGTEDAGMFFLNSDYLNLVVDKATDFIHTPFYRPPQQDARVSQILWMGNLTCSRRASQGWLAIYA